MTEQQHAWVIDVDHEATVKQPSALGNMAEVGGPGGTIGLPIPKPHRFRLVDRDGKPVVEGRTNAATIDPFAPLRDIGRGAFIEYQKGGEWVRPPAKE